jgi:hypothetical protein
MTAVSGLRSFGSVKRVGRLLRRRPAHRRRQLCRLPVRGGNWPIPTETDQTGSRGSSEGNMPCCMANRETAARLDAPDFE